MVVVVDPKKVSRVKQLLKKKKERFFELGFVVKSAKKRDSWVKVTDSTGVSCELHYGAS